jgi:hypothetical protein
MEQTPFTDLLGALSAQIKSSDFRPTFVAMPYRDYLRLQVKRKPYRMVNRLRKNKSS